MTIGVILKSLRKNCLAKISFIVCYSINKLDTKNINTFLTFAKKKKKKIEMKTIKYNHNLYLKCHILLLVGVLEKFINNKLKNYALFPSHYLSAPGLS